MRSGFPVFAAVAAMLALQPSAASERVVHSFCSQANCADGKEPDGGVAVDSAGNVFGTTRFGGLGDNAGTVYEMVRTGVHRWKYKRLHSFCTKPGCPDGINPAGNIILDANGNLYGTAAGGGSAPVGGGVVFRLSPSGAKWKFKVLHSFNAQIGGDGGSPTYLTYLNAAQGLPYDGSAPLYGVTGEGGVQGGGTVFSLTPNGAKWRLRTLYDFCPSGCADGQGPNPGLAFDGSGNIFGTTYLGGAHSNGGTVFELTPGGNRWNKTTLYNFCALADCVDGKNAVGGVAFDSSGNLLGQAREGGGHGFGTIFRLAPDGTNWQYGVLYDLCAISGCLDGANPYPPLLIDANGGALGTTSAGGLNNGGAVFRMNDGGYGVVYSFCSLANCADGRGPAFNSSPAQDSSGNLFGTTQVGGAADQGVLYEISP